MDCERARWLLNPLLDSELDGPQAAEMDAHLDSCSACRAELRGLKRSVSLVEELPSLNPPAGLALRVMARVLQRDEARIAASSNPLGWIIAAAFAGIGALLLYGYLGEVGWPWDPSTLDAVQPLGLDGLASLMASLEVGVIIGATLLFVGMAGLLVQLLGREQQCLHGNVNKGLTL
ncbi:MAG: anti-sigma factor [Dehalococcoidia bacterium]|nr:anti-sigma factor [Dehalococcoidia bacterium]